MDVAIMAPRVIGASLGLLAFSVTVLVGMWAGNSVSLTLSRALWMMLVFCVIGLAAGTAVQIVAREHTKRREKALFPDESSTAGKGVANGTSDTSSTNEDAEPMDTEP